MSFGGQTVTFVSFTNGPPDRFGIPSKMRTQVDVESCRFRPLSSAETVDLYDVGTQVWRCTAPPEPAVLAATLETELVYGDKTFQVVGGPKPYADMDGQLFKVTVDAKVQTG